MLDHAVRDIYPQDTLVLRPRMDQNTLERASFAPFQEDYGVVHPHKQWEA